MKMRKIGKIISQRGHGKNIKKLPSEFIIELTTKIKKENNKSVKKKGKISKVSIAKKLGISERTLRSYKKYFASLENKSIKLGKHDRRPKNEKQFIKKFSKIVDELNKELPKKERIKKTRLKGNKYDVSEIENINTLISKKTFGKLKSKIQEKNVFGFFIRVNVLFITRDGTYDEWLTFIPPVKSSPKLKQFAELNKYLSQELENNFKSKSNIYSYRHSVLGFEIIEVQIIPTLEL